jgi:hypothetical protein
MTGDLVSRKPYRIAVQQQIWGPAEAPAAGPQAESARLTCKRRRPSGAAEWRALDGHGTRYDHPAANPFVVAKRRDYSL